MKTQKRKNEYMKKERKKDKKWNNRRNKGKSPEEKTYADSTEIRN